MMWAAHVPASAVLLRTLVGAVILALALVTGCQAEQPARPAKNYGYTVPSPLSFTPTPEPAVIGTAVIRGRVRVLTDYRRMTLYSRDTPSEVPRPSCVATCADVWRPVIVHGSLPGQQLPGVNIRVRTLPRSGGLHQLAINSHRVYTFSGDRRPGDIKGNLIVTGTPDSRIHMWRPVTVPLTSPTVFTLTGGGSAIPTPHR